MSPTWRIQIKRWARERRQGRCQRQALRAPAPKDKAFSVWEVLIPRNPATPRVLADVCLWGPFTRSRSANAHFWWESMFAREPAAMQPAKPGAALRSNGKPRIPEFDADESLAELRTLAESAGAKVVGEILQRRDRPDPATLIGAGKLEEIAGAAASVNADVLLFDHDLSPSQQRNIEKIV